MQNSFIFYDTARQMAKNMSYKSFRFRDFAKAAIIAVFAIVSHGCVTAQTVPTVISPLRVDPDINGVNVVSGKIAIVSPTISIPAAPNLKFDGVQNSAPYIIGSRTGAVPSGVGATTGNYSIHTGGQTSELIYCSDNDFYYSKSGTGSTFEATANLFTQTGSGAVYKFDLLHSDSVITSPTVTTRTVQYYASSISYPNGEIISFTYETHVLVQGASSRTFYRPTTISSNLGYAISVTYRSNTFTAAGWAAPLQATLYATANPATPLARLRYSGIVNGVISITDLAGHLFKCSRCATALGEMIESSSGSLAFPGETTNTLQVNTSTSGSGQLVGSVVRDGVTWNYAYTNPRINSLASNWIYDGLTVTGPNGYSRNYAFTQSNIGGPGSQTNVISSTTDAINRTTSFTFDGLFRPTSMTMPEGNNVIIEYDGYGNVKTKTTKAKVNSGLTDIVETASVDYFNCDGVLCYRPIWVRDGLGRQTDYVYNIEGQIKERTDPADAGGVRRKTFVT